MQCGRTSSEIGRTDAGRAFARCRLLTVCMCWKSEFGISFLSSSSFIGVRCFSSVRFTHELVFGVRSSLNLLPPRRVAAPECAPSAAADDDVLHRTVTPWDSLDSAAAAPCPVR